MTRQTEIYTPHDQAMNTKHQPVDCVTVVDHQHLDVLQAFQMARYTVWMSAPQMYGLQRQPYICPLRLDLSINGLVPRV